MDEALPALGRGPNLARRVDVLNNGNEMNSQLFFLLNLVFGSIILFWFLSGRKNGSAPPTRLKMQNKNQGGESAASRRVTVKKDYSNPDLFAPAPPSPGAGGRSEKMLNVFFMYNGHSWDAYEVLGVPAGANIVMCTERYQQLIKNADKGKIEFYELAMHAILKSTPKA